MQNKIDFKIDTSGLRDTVMNFIVPLVCFGLSAAMILFVIYPSAQKIPQLKTDLQNKETLRSQLDAKVLVLNKLTDYKAVLIEDLNLLDKVLVSDDNVPYLLNQIDRISRDVGFELNKLNYGMGSGADMKGADSVAEFVAVNLSVTGNYDQVTKFLQNVEKAARLVDVSNFRYGVATSDPSDSKLSLSFLLYSPYLKVNSTATTDDVIQLDISSPEFIKTINMIKGFTYYENIIPSESVKAEQKPISEIVAPPVEEKPVETTETPTPPTPESPTPAL